MRIFHCDRCGGVVPFAADRCPTCEAPIGYDDEQRTPRVLEPTPDTAVYGIDGRPHWRCLNAAWGCNWMLPAPSATPWCRSCRMTRGRPDEGRPAAVEAWMVAEAGKRRLVHQLDELALPLEIRSDATPDGLAFDLVHVPGEGGVTGHLDGVVTLDLSETDDVHREELRRRLGEPFRTVIGHLRHEVGHYFWGRLVGQSDHIEAFRQLFGDERVDYQAAIAGYYDVPRDSWDRTRFITAYAGSHPLEDWAETFAHYLHIIDTIETAVAHDLVPPSSDVVTATDAVATLGFGELLDAWRLINDGVNAVAETIGAPAVYPFDPAGAVVAKLEFVHRQVDAHRQRDRFYAVR